MKRLFDGVIKFRSEDYEERKELFEELGTGQKPHTLFIGCSDSRVVPNLVTKTLPGELFVVRNIANFVPPYRATGEYVSTTAAIEYAVNVLNVENIIVCGHSNCGGCAALYAEPETLKDVPRVNRWLDLGRDVMKQVDEISGGDETEREWMVEQMNVTEQMKRLYTYPFVKERHEAGKIAIYGWYYVIPTGEVFNYNFDSGYFELIDSEK
ncbi:carbonic anhydrase [Limisalsivibrio acetivorans]|uniref:carbonic anhydrase n=1 Tax=Limisalsivibrio acetivorans TaxID=1304888 RepID=UPI0003B550F3|nr:carbonic anhydrase [Limisalsivibrio acetivorans]